MRIEIRKTKTSIDDKPGTVEYSLFIYYDNHLDKIISGLSLSNLALLSEKLSTYLLSQHKDEGFPGVCGGAGGAGAPGGGGGARH